MLAVAHEVPAWFAALLGLRPGEPLWKAAGHKYLRKVPAGVDPKTGRTRYRYFYHVTGGRMLGHHAELVEGAAFRLKHREKEGHLHVVSHDKKTGMLEVHHDESGARAKIHKDVLADLLHREHADLIDEAHEKADRWVNRVQGKKQEKYAREKQAELQQHFRGARTAGARVDLGRQGITPDQVQSAQTFATKAMAERSARAIGLNPENVKKIPPRAASTVGEAGWAMKWIIVPDAKKPTHALTQDAFQEMGGKGKKRVRDLRKFTEEHVKTEKAEKDPDALPPNSREVVKQIGAASGIDISAGEPGDIKDWLNEAVPKRDVERILKLPTKDRMTEAFAAVVRASGAKTWADLVNTPFVGQQNVLGFLGSFPGLKSATGRDYSGESIDKASGVALQLPKEAQKRVDQASIEAEQARYMEERGIDPDDPSTWNRTPEDERSAAEDDEPYVAPEGEKDSDEDVPDWVLERSMRRGSMDLRSRAAAAFARAIPTTSSPTAAPAPPAERSARAFRSPGVDRLRKSLGGGLSGEPLAKCFMKAGNSASADWTEKFKGTAFYADALKLALEDKNARDAVRSKHRAAQVQSDAAYKRYRERVKSAEQEREASMASTDALWEEERKLDGALSDAMSALETKLLELRQAQAQAESSALQKSLRGRPFGSLYRVMEVFGPYEGRSSPYHTI